MAIVRELGDRKDAPDSREGCEDCRRLEGVVEAAALPMPDERLGEAVCVFFCHVDGDPAVEEVREHCIRNIRYPFTPKKLVRLASLPKNHSGKVNKIRLKEMLEKKEA